MTKLKINEVESIQNWGMEDMEDSQGIYAYGKDGIGYGPLSHIEIVGDELICHDQEELTEEEE